MSKNKIVIDLRRIPMTPEQTRELHNALHKTVVSHLAKVTKAAASAKPSAAKKGGKQPAKASKAAPKGPQIAMAEPAGLQTANVAVTITGADPGLSDISVVHKTDKKVLSKSGTVSFDNVSSGDSISVSGKSLGTTTVTIDINADPMSMNFPQGQIGGFFFIN